MRKAAVRHGDPTTTKGFVVALTATIHDAGKKVALSGDQATCGNCKGLFNIFGTGQGMSERGRAVVVDGDLVLCPCKRNRVFVGSNPGIFIESGGGDASSPAYAAQSSPLSTPPITYDEQVRAVASAVPVGYPYFIETTDGQKLAGRLGADGKLPRINTGAVADYTVYWGDDALAQPGFSDVRCSAARGNPT